MNRFRMAVSCPVCGELVVQDGICADFSVPEGVVNLDIFACEIFECHHCGAVIYTGDCDTLYEYEENGCDVWAEDKEDEDDY